MIKPFHVQVPIFLTAVVFCGGCTAEEAAGAMYRYKGKKAVLEPRETSGWVQTANGDIYVWVRDPAKQASMVFHELTHVAFTICELKGMAPDEELICYLVGWLKMAVGDKIFERCEQ